MTAAASRRLTWACALLVLAAVVLLHREVLLGGMVYHMDDAADGYYPSHVAIWRAFRHWELPTWERGSWCGFPLLADPYYGAFYPLSITFALFGMVRGLGVNIALHSLVCAAGMFLLLRRRRLGIGPALLGAVSLALSSFMVERIRHIIFPQLISWVPWVLCGLEGYLLSGRRRELGLLAVSLGLLLVCGGLPLLPFIALVLVAYAGPRLWRARPPLATIGALSAAALVGALLAMAQVVPTLAHLPQSPRQLGVDYAFASTYAWPDYRYLGTLLMPDFFGGEERGQWLGMYNHWELAGWYVGALAIVLAPLGLLRTGRRELWGLFLVALLGIGLAFGDALPIHRWFFRHVPVYAALRCPARALVMLLCAAPILGAEGLTWLLGAAAEGGPRRRVAGALAAALLLGGGGAAYFLLRRPAPLLTPLALAMRQGLGHLLCVCGAGAAVVALRLTRVLAPAPAGLLVALIALGDLLFVGRGYVQPRPADWAEGTERFAAVDWLLSEHPEDRFAPDPIGPFRLHNLGLTYGLQSPGGYDSYSIWRYVQFLHVLNTGAPYPHRQLRHDPAAGDIQRFDSKLVDLLNLRWVIGPRRPAPGWIERFRPPPGAPPHARHEPLWDPQLRVFENPHPLPRAFVVYDVHVADDEQKEARALATLDPRTTVLLPAPPRRPLPADGRDLTPARLAAPDRHRLVIEAETAAPGVLVVSEAFYPGWRAYLDGAPAPLLRADYAFRGVELPAGRHVVELRFASLPTQLGVALSALGLLGLLLLLRPATSSSS